MESKIVNDVQGKYLLLDSKNYKKNFEERMFFYNEVPSFLPFDTQRINNSYSFRYSILDYKTMAEYYNSQTIRAEDVKKIFMAITLAGQSISDFLLNPNCIVLMPEYIFMRGEDIRFCYYPEETVDFNRGIRELMEYILERLDHTQQENVMMAYGLYQKILKNNYTMEQLMEEFFSKNAGELSSLQSSEKKEIGSTEVRNSHLSNTHVGTKFLESEKSFNQEPQTDYAREGDTLIDRNYVQNANGNNLKLKFKSAKEDSSLEDELLEGLSVSANKKRNIKIVSVDSKNGRVEKKTKKDISNSVKDNKKIDKTKWSWSLKRKKEKINTSEPIGTMLLAEPSNYGSTQLLGSKMLNNQGVGKDIPLLDFPITIGSGNQVKAVIDNMMVSRLHAVISQECGLYYVEDEGSTNGTFVNGSRISPYEPVQIKEGDQVTFANEKYCFN